MITDNQLNRVKDDWSLITMNSEACDKLEVINDTIYYFGTELECLRLEHAYRNTKNTRAEYSHNCSTWSFSLSLD
jgi:hypothetical protein